MHKYAFDGIGKKGCNSKDYYLFICWLKVCDCELETIITLCVN